MTRFMLLMLMLCMPLAAQTTVVTVGTVPSPTASGNIFPFNWASGRYQHIFTAQEIGQAGQIMEIRASKNNGTVTNFNGLRVRLGHSNTSPQALNVTFAQNVIGGDPGLVDCLGPAVFTPTEITLGGMGYAVFPFTTNFQYNGTDNLVIDWSYDSKGAGGWSTPISGNAPGRQRLWVSGGNWQSPSGSTGLGGDWVVQLVFVDGPTITLGAAQGAALTPYTHEQGPGNVGLEVATFELAANADPGVLSLEMTGIEIKAQGTGNDSTAFIDVALYRDDNASGYFEPGQDVMIGSPQNFAIDDGTILFSVPTGAEQIFAQNSSKTYFIVVRLAGTAMPGETFNFIVNDVVVTGPGAQSLGVPSAPMTGITIATPEFEFTDTSPTSVQTAYAGAPAVCQMFEIEYLGGPDGKLDTITVTGIGTGDEVAHLTNVQLWYDADDNGSLNAQADVLVHTTNFSAPNGTATFQMTSHPDFQASDVRRFFVVYNVSAAAPDQVTFQCYVSGAGNSAHGGVATGLPVPGVNGTAGLRVSANLLSATLMGPMSPTVVNSNTTGPTGDGVLLADILLSAGPGSDWNATELTFEASPATTAGNHNTAFTAIDLWVSSTNAPWQTGTSQIAAAPSVFVNDTVSFTVTTSLIPAATELRYFLVGRMNGTAAEGETFGASLSSVTASSTIPGGVVDGVPTPHSVALLIDSAALVAGNGPQQPAEIWHKAGSPVRYLVGQFALQALNSDVDVQGMVLTGSGTGDWATDVDPGSGVQLFLDDGDGMFDENADALLFEGPGGALVNAQFASSQRIPISTTAILWVRIGLTSNAGMGLSATAETYRLEVADVLDISSSANVVMAASPPRTQTLGAIEFRVDEFIPTRDRPVGGREITIHGSGFATPLRVLIAGQVCPGTPSINSNGTTVTGLIVPVVAVGGATRELEIVVESGKLLPQTLQQTFDYRASGSGGSSGGGGSSCSGGHGAGWFLLLAAAGILASCRPRRKSAT